MLLEEEQQFQELFQAVHHLDHLPLLIQVVLLVLIPITLHKLYLVTKDQSTRQLLQLLDTQHCQLIVQIPHPHQP